MIFAHGPAGFLTAFITRKFWNQEPKFSKQSESWLYVIAFIGGIAPDIDLFYFYFYSAEISHRQFFTHSLLLWVIIFLIIFLAGYFLKSRFIKTGAFLFFIGNLSHLICDSLYGGFALLWPYTNKMFGLQNIPFISNDFYGENILFINYFIEAVIITVFFFIVLNWIKNKKIRHVLQTLLTLALIIFTVVLFWANQHAYNDLANRYFDDNDKDKIINGLDEDLDGDSILNIDDLDIDNNSISNMDEFEVQINKAEGVWYDVTEGGIIEIPYRLGFQSNLSFIPSFYLRFGININEEMQNDYEQNQEGYETTPNSSAFSRNTQNITTWLSHTNRLIRKIEEIKPGDLIYAHDLFGIAINEEEMILADPFSNKVVIKEIKIEEIDYIGKILNTEE